MKIPELHQELAPPLNKRKRSQPLPQMHSGMFQEFPLDNCLLTLHSLLAGFGSGENEHPGSPPSTSVSPALSKAIPATADKPDDKKESES